MNKQQIRKEYSIEIGENGILTSITVEEINGTGRWVYKRNPRMMEVPITDAIFQETMMVMLFENGINALDKLYVDLCTCDTEYAQKLKKFFKVFLKKCAKSVVGQDALWGE